MFNTYKVRKFNTTKGTEYFGSVVAKTEKEAKIEGLKQLRKPEGYEIEILSSKPTKTFTFEEDFEARYDVIPLQYENE